LLSNKASYSDRSTGPTVTSVSDIGLSLERSLCSTAAAVGGTPAAASSANAASTPASLRRAARYRIAKYSFAARSGCRSASTSYARRKRLEGNRSAR